MNRPRPAVWPAYLVAAACFAIAMISTGHDISESGALKSAQSHLAQSQARVRALARTGASQRTMIADLMSGDARTYPLRDGEVVEREGRFYVVLHGLAAAPKGKTYEVWTLTKGAKAYAPATTFEPGPQGLAVVALPPRRNTEAISITVEPEAGSKTPSPATFASVSLDGSP